MYPFKDHFVSARGVATQICGEVHAAVLLEQDWIVRKPLKRHEPRHKVNHFEATLFTPVDPVRVSRSGDGIALKSHVCNFVVDRRRANNRSPRAEVFSVLASGVETTPLHTSGPFGRIFTLRYELLLADSMLELGSRTDIMYSEYSSRDALDNDDVDIDIVVETT